MTATRSGSCRGCHGPISKGDPIFYTQEDGAWHWDCFEAIPISDERKRWADQWAGIVGLPAVFEEKEKEWSF